LVKEYFQTVFIPYVKCLRRFAEFAEKEVVFLMNNCESHTNDEILTRLAKNRINVIAFASDTAHGFQMLDLSPFGNFKKRSQYGLPLESVQATLNYLSKIA
jgi:hypothetical protein